MKSQQMKIKYSFHDHNSLDCRYTYCPLCGEYLTPKGWRMGCGNETRSYCIEKEIDAGKHIAGWDLDKEPCEVLPLLLNNTVVLCLDNSFVCFEIETARSVWKTEPLVRSLGLSSTPVLLRPFLLFATERNLWKIEPFSSNSCKVESICHDDQRIQLSNTTPVSIEKENVKKAFFLFKNNILICEMKISEQGFSPELTWIPYDDNPELRSPVIFDDKPFYISSNGGVYTIQKDEQGYALQKLITSLGNGTSSAPMIFKTIGNSWLITESFYNGRHYLYARNLSTSNTIQFDLEVAVPNYDSERLWASPIQAGQNVVAVSKGDNLGIHFVNITGNRKNTKDTLTPVRHWQTLGSQSGIIGVVGRPDGEGLYLQLINPDSIRPIKVT